ncbi:MAG: hypothetical protein H6Q72_4042 [Firmicutes bacterium]|nr:hypothetical protein [Bacillota bacterium]
MDEHEKIRDIFKTQGGKVRTADITNAGLHNRWLAKLMQEGKVIRLKQGHYQWVGDEEPEELELLYQLLPDTILCMESALYYYGYTDRTPDRWHIAVDRDSNKKRFRIDYPLIKPHYLDSKYLNIGVTEGNINGIDVRIYDRDRTICDVIRYANKLDREILNKAIQAYLADAGKNIIRLIEYAKQLRVYKKVQLWIGVWL